MGLSCIFNPYVPNQAPSVRHDLRKGEVWPLRRRVSIVQANGCSVLHAPFLDAFMYAAASSYCGSFTTA
eukprot:5132740-Pleurochrysis_carterae.AAC.1